MMDFDSLGRAWRHTGGTDDADTQAQLEDVRARAARLERDVRARDLRESVVALLLLPLFAYLAITAGSLVSAIGAAIVVVACVVVPLRLRRARRGADVTLAVADALRARLVLVRAQERLLGTVAWWYFLPLAGGVLLYVLGGDASASFKLAYLAGVVLLCAWLLRMNQRVVRSDVRPLAAELERWIEDLEESDMERGG